jgi:hypothetical protein
LYLKNILFIFFAIQLASTLFLTAFAWGEVRVRPSLTISERYDSNPFFSGNDEVVVDDYITSISPLITFDTLGEMFALSGSYRLDAILYHDQQSLNFLAHNASLELGKELTKTSSVSASDTLTITEDSIEALGINIQTNRTGIINNLFTLSASHQLSPNTTLEASFTNGFSEFDDPSLTDTRTDSFTLTALYGSSLGRETKVNYTFSNYSYDTLGQKSHTDTHALNVGVTERVRPDTSVEISGGVVYTPEFADRVDWSASLTLAYDLPRTQASLGYIRNVAHTSAFSNEISISDRGFLVLKYSPLTSLTLGFSDTLLHYRSRPSGDVDISSHRTGLDVTWRPYRWMSMGLGYSHLQQWSDSRFGDDLSRDQAYVNITLSPAAWVF